MPPPSSMGSSLAAPSRFTPFVAPRRASARATTRASPDERRSSSATRPASVSPRWFPVEEEQPACVLVDADQRPEELVRGPDAPRSGSADLARECARRSHPRLPGRTIESPSMAAGAMEQDRVELSTVARRPVRVRCDDAESLEGQGLGRRDEARIPHEQQTAHASAATSPAAPRTRECLAHNREAVPTPPARQAQRACEDHPRILGRAA